jgi:hypothetical protein
MKVDFKTHSILWRKKLGSQRRHIRSELQEKSLQVIVTSVELVQFEKIIRCRKKWPWICVVSFLIARTVVVVVSSEHLLWSVCIQIQGYGYKGKESLMVQL